MQKRQRRRDERYDSKRKLKKFLIELNIIQYKAHIEILKSPLKVFSIKNSTPCLCQRDYLCHSLKKCIYQIQYRFAAKGFKYKLHFFILLCLMLKGDQSKESELPPMSKKPQQKNVAV